MARIIEAKAVISAADKTGGVFAAVAAKVKKLERMSGPMGRAGAMFARADRAASGLGMSFLGGAAGIGAIGGAIAASKLREAIVDFAALERHMNRIGITAGATEAETAAAIGSVKDLAQSYKMPLDDVVKGLDALTASGLGMREAMDFLPSVLATAQASGAATDDMAKSAQALSVSLKVSSGEMQAAFDAMVTGGNLGLFELKDMALYFPKVTSSAQKLGFAGLDGVQRLTAMLQVAMKVSGTAEQAATGVGDAMEKILSPTVGNALKKQGVNIGTVLKTAQKEGKNAIEAVVEVIDKLSKGKSDIDRDLLISSIFTESDSRRFITAMVKMRDTYGQMLGDIKKGQGAVSQALGRITKDSQAQIQDFSNKLSNMGLAIGQAAAPLGMQILERMELEFEEIKRASGRIDAWMKRNLGFGLDDLPSIPGMGPPQSNEDLRAQQAREDEERANPAMKRVHALEAKRAEAQRKYDEARRTNEAQAGNKDPMRKPSGFAVQRENQLAQELDAIEAALQDARWSAERAAKAAKDWFDQHFPADSPTWGTKAEFAAPEKLPPAGAPLPARNPLRASADGGFGEPTKAVVEGPITAEVTGQANVNVNVTVTPSPFLNALVEKMRAAPMPLSSAPTGKSMSGAGKSAGSGEAYDF